MDCGDLHYDIGITPWHWSLPLNRLGTKERGVYSKQTHTSQQQRDGCKGVFITCQMGKSGRVLLSQLDTVSYDSYSVTDAAAHAILRSSRCFLSLEEIPSKSRWPSCLSLPSHKTQTRTDTPHGANIQLNHFLRRFLFFLIFQSFSSLPSPRILSSTPLSSLLFSPISPSLPLSTPPLSHTHIHRTTSCPRHSHTLAAPRAL